MVRSVEVRSPSLASRSGCEVRSREFARPLVPRACIRARPRAPRGGRPSPRMHTSSCPTGPVLARPLQLLDVAALRRVAHVHLSTGSSRAPTSAPRGGHSTPRARTCPRPTGSRSRAPTSAPRGGRPSPLPSVSSFHRQPFSRAHFSTSRWPLSAAHAHVHLSHGQPFSRAHLSTSRWPPCAAAQHVRSCHGQPFSRAHAAPRCGRPSPRTCTSLIHGKFSARRSAFNASRSPIRAADRADARQTVDLGADTASVLTYPRSRASC